MSPAVMLIDDRTDRIHLPRYRLFHRLVGGRRNAEVRCRRRHRTLNKIASRLLHKNRYTEVADDHNQTKLRFPDQVGRQIAELPCGIRSVHCVWALLRIAKDVSSMRSRALSSRSDRSPQREPLALWRVGDDLPLRYGCHSGHAFSAVSPGHAQKRLLSNRQQRRVAPRTHGRFQYRLFEEDRCI